MPYIVIQSNKTGNYRIYTVTNEWNKIEKKTKQKREYLGVLDKEHNELLLGAKSPIPDDVSLKLLTAKGIHYLNRRAGSRGRPRKDGKPKVTAESKRASAEERIIHSKIVCGQAEVFIHLAKTSGLSGALDSVFGEARGFKLLILAIHQACENEVINLDNEWFEDSGYSDALASSTITQLTNRLSIDKQNKFFKKWISACDIHDVLIHDYSSIPTYDQDLDLSGWDYNCDKEELPKVNLALVVSQETQLPLWYRIVPESIPDVASLRETCKVLNKTGVENFIFTLDRDYYSNENLAQMVENDLGFNISVPLTNKQAKALLKKNQKALQNKDKKMRHVKIKFTVKSKKGKKIILPAHLYIDPERKEQSTKRFETAISELIIKSSKAIFKSKKSSLSWISDNAGRLNRFLKISYKNEQFKVVHNSNLITKAVNDFGITLLVTTNPKQKQEQVISYYRTRDIAEKVFDSYKNGIDSNHLRSSIEKIVHARLFVAFLAVTLRSILESKLRQMDLLKDYSLQEAIRQLGKIKKLRCSDGSIVQLDIPDKAKEIANAMGMDIP
jgi:transposase